MLHLQYAALHGKNILKVKKTCHWLIFVCTVRCQYLNKIYLITGPPYSLESILFRLEYIHEYLFLTIKEDFPWSTKRLQRNCTQKDMQQHTLENGIWASGSTENGFQLGTDSKRNLNLSTVMKPKLCETYHV